MTTTLKIIYRRLLKNKGYALINILGLSVSIASALIILMIISFDLNFDNYHSDSERIYRLIQHENLNGEFGTDSGMPFPLRKSFKEDFTDTETMVMVDNHATAGIVKVEIDGKPIRFDEDDEKMAFVMPDYFELFNYEIIAGDIKDPLAKPNTIVIAQSLAEKYFDVYTDALGKSLNIDNVYDFEITAIIKDPPLNTDLPFTILMSFDTGGEERVWDHWDGTSSSVQVFVKLKEKVNLTNFQSGIKEYIQMHKGKNAPVQTDLLLQPLSEMHHSPDYPIYGGRVAIYKELYTLGAIALLILIAASINFINLSTALAVRRSKEIGVRKVLGSDRIKLVGQFLMETGFITFISIIIALGLSELAYLKIESVTGFSVPSTTYDIHLFGTLALLFISVTLLSGLYPAVVLSGFKPVQALKNKITEKNQSGISLRKSLIVLQIVISQVLVIAVIVVWQQIDHFLNQPMGFDKEAIVEFSMPDPEKTDFSAFRNQLVALSGIRDVAFSNTGTASDDTWGGFARMTRKGEKQNLSTQIKIIDPYYLETYGLALISGRNVRATNDSLRSYLVNETLTAEMGFETAEEAIGQDLRIWGVDGKIVGIVADYHTLSLHHEVEPVAMWYSESQRFRAAVKLESSNWSETIAQIQELWEKENPEYIFSYKFLDDQIAQFYEKEQRLSRTFTLFAFVALFIGAIGLLGLMSYLVTTRTKEIGVRKILGAKVAQLLRLLSADFVLMVGVAFLFTVPISWYFMSQWLQGFASRIDISTWVYIIALVFSLLITLLTVGYQSFKAAIANPINSLRDE